MAQMSLKLDCSDPDAVIAFVAEEVTHWSEAQRQALWDDFQAAGWDQLVEVSCEADRMSAAFSAVGLDILRRHGLTGPSIPGVS